MLKDEQSATTEKLTEVTQNVKVNAEAISQLNADFKKIKVDMAADKVSMHGRLSTLIGSNSASSEATGQAVLQAAQSSSELVISGIPSQVVDKMSPNDVTTAVLTTLNLNHLTGHVLNIRKFENRSMSSSRTEDRTTRRSHSFLVYMKSSQIMDFIVETKRNLKSLPVKEVYPGL